MAFFIFNKIYFNLFGPATLSTRRRQGFTKDVLIDFLLLNTVLGVINIISTHSSLQSLTCAQCNTRSNLLVAMRCVSPRRHTTASASTSAVTVKPRSGPP